MRLLREVRRALRERVRISLTLATRSVFLPTGEGRGQQRRHRADGRAGRSSVQGLQRDAGLLERRGDDEEGDRRGRVAEIRVFKKTTVDTVTVASTPTKTKPRPVSGVFAQGHSDDERGRLRGGDRQDQRHHHPGRREHTAAGDRVFSGVPSRNRAGSGSYANGTRSADFPRVPVTAVKRKRYRTCFAAARGVAVVTE